MRQPILLTVTILILLVASPGLAEAPRGGFGGIVGGATAGGGVIALHGWALDDDGVKRVDIFVDGVSVGLARYGRSRPDVENRFPGYPDSSNAGFAFRLDTTRYNNGLHEVRPRVITNSGEERFLRAKTLEFTNTVHTLAPFGRIDFPNEDAQLFGTCDVSDPDRRYSIVNGWALDAGIETGDEGMGYVELLINGSIIANTRTDCYFAAETGGLTDCLGLTRLDIEERFPNLKDSPNSGFRFALDVGALIDYGFVRGFNVLTIRAGDIAGQVANIDEIPVVFLCDEDVDNEGAIGRIGQPINGHQYSGEVLVTGWVIDWEGIDEIRVYVDGKLAGFASYGFPRPAVADLYPSYPGAAVSGFHYVLDSTAYTDGDRNVQVIVIDDLGGETLLGEAKIRVNNLVGQ